MNGRLHFLLLACLGLAACDSTASPDASTDSGGPLGPSELFGPCVEDWQCPGEGAICRTARDGMPGGYCTVPCADRTPCDYRGVYHHCVAREGELQAYCERRCLNGIDCGRDAYTCSAEELPPSGGVCIPLCSSDEQCGSGTRCNPYTGECVVGEVPTTGGETGAPCDRPQDCRSGLCVPEVDSTGAPTGWQDGYCYGSCILPSGFNNNTFYAGETLPQGTCPGDAVCLPAAGQSRGDLGTCYAQCTRDDDCRAGYGCLKEFPLNSGGVARYTNGVCVPL